VLASNIRIALAVAYLVLLVWRSRVEGHIPEYWWIVIAVYFLSIQATRWAESLWNWWQLRQTVRSFGMLEPAAKEAALTRLWSASARHHLAELVKDEGEPEIGDSIERYPFTRSARRETTVAFWVMAGLSAILFGALIAWPHRVAAGFGWFAWTLAGGGTVTAAILRHRMHFLESTLEVSRFGLAQVDGEGTRRVISWTAPLVLRYRRWPQRFEVGVIGRRDLIRLDFDRVGIDRAFRLTVEYGGFPDVLIKGDAA